MTLLLIGSIAVSMLGIAASFAHSLDAAEVRRVAARAELQVSERQHAEGLELFETAFSHAPIGMALLGLDGHWLKVNGALCEMTGWSEAELLRRRSQDITRPGDLDADLEYVRRALSGEIDDYEIEKRYLRADGSAMWALMSASLLRTPDGSPRHFVAQIQDISARKRAETELALQGRITDNMAEGTLVVRADDLRIIDANRAAERMFGYERDELVGAHAAVLNAAIQRGPRETAAHALDAFELGGWAWSGDILSVRRDESTFWRHATVSRFEDPELGGLLVSVLTDVTEQRERDAEAAALSELSTLVAQGVGPATVFGAVAEQIARLFEARTGAVSRFQAATNQGLVLGGWTPDGEVIAGAVFALDGFTASAEVFRTGRPARTDRPYDSDTDPIAPLMARLGSAGGVAAPIVVAGTLWGALGAAYGSGGMPSGVEVRLERFAHLVALAISNAEAWDRLNRQAATDPLTGIANHRTFHGRLLDEVQRAHRYARPLSLVLLDLDHFKSVNDHHGHQGGDRVLVHVAQLLDAQARQGELVARIGGEEFAWIMPETSAHGARAAAERVRRAIRSSPLADIGTVTVSAGVCTNDLAVDADALVRFADDALYRAKDRGRDTTVVYTDETHATLAGRAPTGPLRAT